MDKDTELVEIVEGERAFSLPEDVLVVTEEKWNRPGSTYEVPKRIADRWTEARRIWRDAQGEMSEYRTHHMSLEQADRQHMAVDEMIRAEHEGWRR